MNPTIEAVRDQLDRLLASGSFAKAGRHRRLLQYLVERALAGDRDQLKEYVVATEVFGRPDTYDPRLDSIVRVEARRLRARLEAYYRGPGRLDAVIISIPRGCYVPEFTLRRAHASRSSDHSLRNWLVATAVAIAILFLPGVRKQATRSSTESVPPNLGMVVLPFETFSTIEEHRVLAEQLTDDVTTALATAGNVSVASRASARHYAREPRRIRDLAVDLGVRFALEASAQVDGQRARVVVRLVDAAIDRKVWVRVYTVNAAELGGLAPRIAGDAAAAAIQRTPRASL